MSIDTNEDTRPRISAEDVERFTFNVERKDNNGNVVANFKFEPRQFLRGEFEDGTPKKGQCYPSMAESASFEDKVNFLGKEKANEILELTINRFAQNWYENYSLTKIGEFLRDKFCEMASNLKALRETKSALLERQMKVLLEMEKISDNATLDETTNQITFANTGDAQRYVALRREQKMLREAIEDKKRVSKKNKSADDEDDE